MTDKKQARPDDPVAAQKAAIDSTIPYDDSTVEPAREVAQAVPEGTPFEAPPVISEAIGAQTNDPALMEVLARMQQQIAELTAAAQTQATLGDGDTGPGGFPWQYYKRREDGGLMSGWVTIGPGGAVPTGPRRGKHDSGSRQTYLAKGMRLITDCGVAPIPSDVKRPGEEFVTLLRNGGARHVPAAQVLALKWHVSPPVPGTIFPEYEKVKAEVQSFACDECDFECYFLPGDHSTIRGCFSHLRQSHQYRREEASLALQAQRIDYRGARFAVRAAGVAAGAVAREPVAAGVGDGIEALKELPD